MTESTVAVEASDGSSIALRHWPAPTMALAVVQICHGLAEHSARYARLARVLNAAGFSVVAHDHRGHGPTAVTPGLFAERNGWALVLDDTKRVADWSRQHYGDAPHVLLGHSMGSYVAQGHAAVNGGELAALVLSGSNFGSLGRVRLGRIVAWLERWRIGKSAPSSLLDKMSFGEFNKAFEPARTPFDWLSRDPLEVDRYIADPFCGFKASPGLWLDLLGALSDVWRVEFLKSLPAALPVYVIGGSDDPVSAGNGLTRLATALADAGVRNVDLEIYDEARHELFNETNRDAVSDELIAWLENRVLGEG